MELPVRGQAEPVVALASPAPPSCWSRFFCCSSAAVQANDPQTPASWRAKWSAILTSMRSRVAARAERAHAHSPMHILVELLVRMYAHEDVVAELAVFDAAHPEELQQCLSSVLGFLVHSRPDQVRSLERFVVAKCHRSLPFAHRVCWYLSSHARGCGYLAEDPSLGGVSVLTPGIPLPEAVTIAGCHAALPDTSNLLLPRRLVSLSGESLADDSEPAAALGTGMGTGASQTIRSGEGVGTGSGLGTLASLGFGPVTDSDTGGTSPTPTYGSFGRHVVVDDVGMNAFLETIRLVDSLTELAHSLFVVRLQDRTTSLRAGLVAVNDRVLASHFPVFLPIGTVPLRVLCVHPERSFPRSTKARVPCVVTFEVIDPTLLPVQPLADSGPLAALRSRVHVPAIFKKGFTRMGFHFSSTPLSEATLLEGEHKDGEHYAEYPRHDLSDDKAGPTGTTGSRDRLPPSTGSCVVGGSGVYTDTDTGIGAGTGTGTGTGLSASAPPTNVAANAGREVYHLLDSPEIPVATQDGTALEPALVSFSLYAGIAPGPAAGSSVCAFGTGAVVSSAPALPPSSKSRRARGRSIEGLVPRSPPMSPAYAHTHSQPLLLGESPSGDLLLGAPTAVTSLMAGAPTARPLSLPAPSDVTSLKSSQDVIAAASSARAGAEEDAAGVTVAVQQPFVPGSNPGASHRASAADDEELELELREGMEDFDAADDSESESDGESEDDSNSTLSEPGAVSGARANDDAAGARRESGMSSSLLQHSDDVTLLSPGASAAPTPSPRRVSSPKASSNSAQRIASAHHVFSKPWAHEATQVRQASPYGSIPGWRLVSVIFKSNDDLRQEQFVCMLVKRFAALAAAAGVPVWLSTYDIVATSHGAGAIEVITDSVSLDSLKKSDVCFTTLNDFFERRWGQQRKLLQATRRNFVASMAAYSIVTYLLQIKDRHNGNLMLDSQGHLVHIDFGFLLTSSPGGNAAFESAPFKLTDEFVAVMGGHKSQLFAAYRKLCVRTFLAFRSAREEVCALVEMVLSSSPDLPCFVGGAAAVMAGLQARFLPGVSKRAAALQVHHLIDVSLRNWSTSCYDKYQRCFTGIL